jgi:5-methylcytosine-specific restriction endonuclease McrA
MSDVHPIKKCRICLIEKPIDDFEVSKSTKDRRRTDCRDCKSIKAATYYAKHRDHVKKRTSRYYKANRDAVLAYQSVYRKTHQDKIKHYKVRYTEKNRSKISAKRKAYRLANIEKIKARDAARYPKERKKRLASVAAYRKANPEKVKKVKSLCYKKNPDLARRAKAKRRALKAGATIGDLKRIAAWSKTWCTAKSVACHWCGKKFRGRDCHADHRIPLSKGGKHDVENLVVSCKSCNLKKNDTLPEQFNASLNQPWLFC